MIWYNYICHKMIELKKKMNVIFDYQTAKNSNI